MDVSSQYTTRECNAIWLGLQFYARDCFSLFANECLDSARRTGQTENRVDTTSVGLAHARPNY